MDFIHLMEEINKPYLHQQLLGNFNGTYSLGISQEKEELFLVLMISKDKNESFPSTINIGGEKIRVKVEKFQSPTLL